MRFLKCIGKINFKISNGMQSRFPRQTYERNAELYKMLAHPKRLEILNTLYLGDASLEELTDILEAPKPYVCQHLAMLKQARVVKVNKKGKSAHYHLVDKRIVSPCKVLKALWENSK